MRSVGTILQGFGRELSGSRHETDERQRQQRHQPGAPAWGREREAARRGQGDGRQQLKEIAREEAPPHPRRAQRNEHPGDQSPALVALADEDPTRGGDERDVESGPAQRAAQAFEERVRERRIAGIRRAPDPHFAPVRGQRRLRSEPRGNEAHRQAEAGQYARRIAPAPQQTDRENEQRFAVEAQCDAAEQAGQERLARRGRADGQQMERQREQVGRESDGGGGEIESHEEGRQQRRPGANVEAGRWGFTGRATPNL